MWNLAQINIANMRYPLHDERMEGFVSQLGRVNDLAEQSSGFVWRLSLDSEALTKSSEDIFGETILVNMSLWRTMSDLRRFMALQPHRAVMAKREQWFAKLDPHVALWWQKTGTTPTMQDAKRRLDLLAKFGPNAQAFTFAKSFPADDNVA